MDHVEQGEAGGGIVPDEQIDIARDACLAARDRTEERHRGNLHASKLGLATPQRFDDERLIHSHIITQNTGPSDGFR